MRNSDRRTTGPRYVVTLVAGLFLFGAMACKDRTTPSARPAPSVVAPLPPVNPPPLRWQEVTRDGLWLTLKQLEDGSKYQEATKVAGQLYEQARAQGQQEAWAQALVRLTQLRMTAYGPGGGHLASFEDAIQLLREAKWPDAPLPRLAVELFYAHSLILFLDVNSYQVRLRERVAAGPQFDLKVATTEQIVAEAQRTLGKLWEQRAALGGTPVTALSAILHPNTYPADIRGTLRDALTYRIVELLGDTSYWQPAQSSELYRLDFAALRAPDPRVVQTVRIDDPQQHPIVRAVAALADLEAWHARSDRRGAALEARLTAIRSLRAVFTMKAERDALRADLQKELQDPALRSVPWSAMGQAVLANMMEVDLGDRVRAHELAQAGATAFADSEGGKECARIVARISAPVFSVSSMLADGAGQRSLRVEHRNLAALYFRAYAVDFSKQLTTQIHDRLVTAKHEARYLIYGDPDQHRPAAAPVAEWTVQLAKTPDFQDHSTFVSPPLLRHGLYVIAASYKPDFARQDNQVQAVNFQRSELALVTRTLVGGDTLVTVVEAATGRPALGARVAMYTVSLNTPPRHVETRVVDATGTVRITRRRDVDHAAFLAERGDDRIIDDDMIYIDNSFGLSDHPFERIYTDRSVYRPQQKLYFKVLAYTGNTDSGRFKPRINQPIKVRLLDAKYQEVAQHQLTTNGFGTAAGEFIIPAGRPLGRWSVHTANDSNQVLVEEYKRPTFEVALQVPKAALRLNQAAVLTGEARYYFGLPVSHGVVRYQVSRKPQNAAISEWMQPLWLRRERGLSSGGGAVTVAHGEAPLAADGSFRIGFTPQADARKDPGTVYSYLVTADLTDEGGETRSASRTYHAGFVAVQAALSADFGFLSAGATTGVIKVVRQDLDGAPRSGVGSYKLVRLVQPKVAALPAEVPFADEPASPSAPAVMLPGDRQRPRFATGYDPAALLATWADGEIVQSAALAASASGESQVTLPALLPGPYRLRYETKDEFGTPYTAAKEFLVAAEKEGASTAVALTLEVEQPTVRVGQTARVLLHSGFAEQLVYFEVYRGGMLILRRLVTPSAARLIELPIREADRGGFSVQAFMVRDHQLIALQRSVAVPWDNMELKLAFSTFRDLLRPGEKEKWRITVHAPDGKALAKGAAELLTLMHDRSLDLFAPFAPSSLLDLFPSRHFAIRASSSCTAATEFTLADHPQLKRRETSPLRGDKIDSTDDHVSGSRYSRHKSYLRGALEVEAKKTGDALKRISEVEVDTMDVLGEPPVAKAKAHEGSSTDAEGAEGEAARKARPPLEATPRTNFAETAFFFPQLLTDSNAGVAFEFTVPESTTAWRVWAQALTRTLQSGTIEAQVRTAKELMVRPYLPRFLREGDKADLRVVINNAGTKPYDGTLDLAVLDGDSREPRTAAFGVTQPSQRFHVEPGQGTTVSFALLAPREVGLYAVQVSARAGEVADGELRPLPVLPSRMHLLQSKFVALREPGTRTLQFADMKKNDDPTRLSEQLVVTVDAQLFYTALKALPYLTSYPYECTEQTLNRFLSTGIVASLFTQHPEIGRAAAALAKQRQTALDPWDQQDPNRKLALEESPWLQESRGGDVSRRDARLLRVLDPEIARANRDSALLKLRKAQLASGGFPWFAGGPVSPQMTLYLVLGFARAAEFQGPIEGIPIGLAWRYLLRQYRDEYGKHLEDGTADAIFLTGLNYAASAFASAQMARETLPPADQAAILNYTFSRWQKLPRLVRAQLALTLKRVGREKDARMILDSILDATQTDANQGTYFVSEGQPWFWYNDTIESHAFILRTLIEIDPQNAKKDGLVLWLLVNKKLNQWKSTRATAEVLYALAHVMKQEGTLGIKEEALVRAGASEQRFTFLPDKYVGKAQLVIPAAQIDPAQSSTITITKTTPGTMFASATWHFSTDQLPTQAVGDLFHVERRYFKRANDGKEYVLTPLVEGTPLAIGDELEVQLTLRNQQSAEYVHLRDPRGAGLEPEHATSRYRWDLGVGAYEEVRDSGTNYFFERLPAGQYVLKYRLRANLAGAFRVGPATVQSLYAPEFAAYSAGQLLKILPEATAP